MVGTSNQLFIRGSNLRKNQVVAGKTPLFVLGPFCAPYFKLFILFLLTLASNRAVLYGNVAFSFSVHWTRTRYSNFLKKVFVFQKTCFKVEVSRNFYNFQWLSHKNMPISQIEGYFKNLYGSFLEGSMLFLLALKWNL